MAEELSGRFDRGLVLKKPGLARSRYDYVLRHPPKPARPECWEKAGEIFRRTRNGCGFQQIWMCLGAELDCRISRKTILKLMREAGIVCKILRKRFRPNSSYKGHIGETARNIINRNFQTSLPWRKMGTDVTKFTQPWGRLISFKFMISAQKKSWLGPFQDMPTGNNKNACLKIYCRNCLREYIRYFMVIWDGNINCVLGWTSCRKWNCAKYVP